MPSRSARERAEREARRRARSYSARRALHADRIRRRRRDDVIAAIVLAVVLVLTTTAQVLFFTAGPGAPKPAPSASATPTPTPSPTPSATRTLPPKSLSGDRTWTGSLTLNTTKLGITLNGAKAPQAVANFVALTRSGFYSGVSCHRLTTAGLYVLQCGDPTGTGSGGPGYSFGPIENAPKSGTYRPGVIAMANTGAANSQGSQFFIVYRTSDLPAPGYTVFGSVTSGLPALQKAVISKGVAAGGSSATDGAPEVATKITALTVR